MSETRPTPTPSPRRPRDGRALLAGDELPAGLQRGDGRRHDRLAAQRLRARHPARGGPRRRAARRRVQHRQHGAEHALHPAGRRRGQRRAGAAAGPGDEERRGRRRGVHQPGHHPGRAVPRPGHRAAGRRRAAADAALPRPRLLRPRAGRPAGVGRRLRPLLPAAGVLLRHVRAGGPGAELPRPLRPDDVGADRQQRDRGGRPGRLPDHDRPGPGGEKQGGLRVRGRAAAGARLDAGHRGAAAGAGALPESAGFRFRPRFDFRAPDWATRCGWASGRCCSWWSTRSPTRWSCDWPAAAPSGRWPGGPGTEGTGYTVYSNAFLLTMVPHAIITVSLATAMLPLLSGYAAEATWARSGGRCPRRCGRRTPWSCRPPSSSP